MIKTNFRAKCHKTLIDSVRARDISRAAEFMRAYE